MKAIKILVVASCVVALIAPVIQGENDFSKVGTSGAQFLKLGVGARYTAMGDASVAVVNDGYAMYWNPAAMGGSTNSHLEFTNISWIDGVDLNFFSYTRPTSFGNLGASVTALTSGDMEITTVDDPDGTGKSFSASSYAITLGYARQMTDFFAVGMNAKYVSERISEERAAGIGFDFGTMLRPGYKNLRVGMSISNLGPELKLSGPELNFIYNPQPGNENYDNAKGVASVESYDLPLVFRIGAAYDWESSEHSRVTFAVEAHDPSDNQQQASIGTEVSFYEHYFLRGGWKFNSEEESATLGGGLNLKIWEHTHLGFNYAWADFGRLSSVHRFSVGFKF